MNDPAYDVFISHADADRAWVEGFLLPALGLPPERIITKRDFQLGAAIVAEFEHAVASSRYTLVVFSPSYLADEWSTFGAELASYSSVAERRDRLIPLVLKPCELTSGLHQHEQLGRRGFPSTCSAESAGATARTHPLSLSWHGALQRS
jgi:hypothetical protein